MGLVALVYSVIVYLAFFASFLYLIAFLGGDSLAFLGLPKTINAGASIFPAAPAALINLALLLLFGVQHSVMARPSFKRVWTKVVPTSMERSTYVLATVAVMVLLFAGWKPMPDIIWSVGGVWGGLLTALCYAGFGIVLLSTFMINHFELFGLQQGWFKFKSQNAKAPKFVVPLLYSVVRHPLYLGFLIAFWAAPHMTAGHLLFSAIWTAYIFVAIGYEERDLISVFGDKYHDYMAKTPSILPFGAKK